MKFYAGTFDGRVLGFISTAQGVQHIERSEMVEERALIPRDQNAKNGSDSRNAFAHARLDRRRDGVPWSESRPNNTQGWSIDPGTKERPYRGTKSSFSFIAGLDIFHQDNANGLTLLWREFGFRSLTFDDIDGHGTAVASVAAGLTVGAANAATIIPMKVQTHFTDLVDDGRLEQGQTFGKFKPAIISISITMPADSEVLEEAITAAMAAGIHVVIFHAAAGNKGANQLKDSEFGPDHSRSDRHQRPKKASFSNFGPCVDVYAPGESILAADFTSGGLIDPSASTGNLSPPNMKKKILADATDKIVDIAAYAKSQDRLAVVNQDLINLVDHP
ncbi:peptidase S8/S53 domain-containing protein [Mycena leptocephala]|nr:peptidase S8/S53 domain-containing protein [Mycena leptocephala]